MNWNCGGNYRDLPPDGPSALVNPFRLSVGDVLCGVERVQRLTEWWGRQRVKEGSNWSVQGWNWLSTMGGEKEW